jgi:hypothetical protein
MPHRPRPARRGRRLLTLALVALAVAVIALAATVAGMASRANPAPAPAGVVTTAPPVCDRDPATITPPRHVDGGYTPQPASSYDPEAC